MICSCIIEMDWWQFAFAVSLLCTWGALTMKIIWSSQCWDCACCSTVSMSANYVPNAQSAYANASNMLMHQIYIVAAEWLLHIRPVIKAVRVENALMSSACWEYPLCRVCAHPADVLGREPAVLAGVPALRRVEVGDDGHAGAVVLYPPGWERASPQSVVLSYLYHAKRYMQKEVWMCCYQYKMQP